MSPPAGIVALLFADLEKSTAGLERLGDTFRDAIRRLHNEAVAAAERHGGVYTHNTGDGFYLAFPAPLAAILCARDLQACLLSPEWRAEHPQLRLRIGVHTGPVGFYDGKYDPQYDGLTVWQAHGLMDAAHGTQILISGATHILVEHEFADYPELKCEALGPYRLRELQEAMPLFRVTIVGLTGQSDKPPRARALGHHNFLDDERPFIGRENEVAAVTDYFRRQQARLVTITGIGGMGKTRLAKQAALEMEDDFPDGVCLVELDTLSHRDEILPAICNALHLEPVVGENEQLLYDTLDARRMLLVLDCFEILKEHADVIEKLLKFTTEPCCLVTSRQVLGLAREFTYPLDPMFTGDKRPGHRPLGDGLALFEEAARHVQPAFVLTAQNRDIVHEICELMEGIPLSIVFAAGWLRYLTLDELYTQARTRRLEILTPETSGPGDNRHHDVKSVIENSFVLLPKESQQRLHQLGTFVGGFGLDDAQKVCDEPLPMVMVKQIGRLGDHSFVQKKTQGERTRYRVLDTVREYLDTVEKDAALHEELVRCRQRHAAHYGAIARKLHLQMQQGQWIEGSATLWTEIGNLRAAATTTIEQGEKASIIELGDALLRLYLEAGLWTDFTSLMQATETAAASLDRRDALTRLLGLQGAFAKRRGDTVSAQRLWERRLRLCQEIGDTRPSVDTLLDLAQLAQEASRFEDAQRLIKEAMRLAKAGDLPVLMAKGLALLAEIALAQKDLPRAARHADAAKRRLAQAPELDIHLKIQLTLGRVYREGGEDNRAVTAFQEMLRAAVEGNRAFDISRALLELGPIYERNNQMLSAARTYLAAERCLQHRPSPRYETARDELRRFESQTTAPEVHAFLREARQTTWQYQVAELLNSSG